MMGSETSLILFVSIHLLLFVFCLFFCLFLLFDKRAPCLSLVFFFSELSVKLKASWKLYYNPIGTNAEELNIAMCRFRDFLMLMLLCFDVGLFAASLTLLSDYYYILACPPLLLFLLLHR